MLNLGCIYPPPSWAAMALEAASKPGVWESVLPPVMALLGSCERDWRAAVVCAVAHGKVVAYSALPDVASRTRGLREVGSCMTMHRPKLVVKMELWIEYVWSLGA
ncbi:hypothetical protein CGRA01v4_01698 [Colletotrichum graminicola]|nr:hypothetical protein CGRA01v4_01698 [Colletotrichum graminicola]